MRGDCMECGKEDGDYCCDCVDRMKSKVVEEERGRLLRWLAKRRRTQAIVDINEYIAFLLRKRRREK